jgi:hypothetical protein
MNGYLQLLKIFLLNLSLLIRQLVLVRYDVINHLHVQIRRLDDTTTYMTI